VSLFYLGSAFWREIFINEALLQENTKSCSNGVSLPDFAFIFGTVVTKISHFMSQRSSSVPNTHPVSDGSQMTAKNHLRFRR
jgi:hypothetical protein